MLAIEDPIHGAVLNSRHGCVAGSRLAIRVRGAADLDDRVTVNGVPATREGRRFLAEVTLNAGENEIVVRSDGITGRAEHVVKVVWDRYSFPRYRGSLGDNSFFLRHGKTYGNRLALRFCA